MNTGPHDDQTAAKQRDLLRLGNLLTAHFTGNPPPPLSQILARMTPADRAEATAIFERLGDSTEPPEVTRARQESLLSLARVEAEALDILKQGQPRHRNGKVLYDPQTGKPLRNRNIDRSARALLRKVRRDQARLAGLPPPADNETPP